ncbi:MAG: universal stress protein [Flavobacteriaceae bacterium]|nr:universal stress protein [Flavobacteriaceae bacterium]
MKSILLPTDFSNNSINAIHYVHELFKNERCEFYLLNVQRASSYISDDLMALQPSTTIYENLIENAKQSLQKIITNVKKKYKVDGHIYHSIVDYDNFIDSINQLVASKDICLIAMGTKGATGAEKVLFGSNTVKVIQRADCPVLAVPDNCKFGGVNKIAFPSNYLTLYKKEEIKPLITIAEMFDANIDVLHLTKGEHLTEDQENNRAFLDECFMNVNHEFINLANTKLFETVEHYVLYNDIDLLAMMGRKHSFMERIFNRHNVETFAFKISVPFLVMPNTGKITK